MTNPYVNNRALLALLKTMSAEGHDLDPVFGGLPFTRASLDPWSGRVHWNDYIEFFERIEALLGEETFFRLAHGYSTSFPEFRAFAGAVISPARLARVVSLLSASAFPMLRYQCDITDERFVQEGFLDDPALRPSASFFRVSGAAWAALPCHLGYAPAKVTCDYTSRWSQAVVPLPKSRAVPSWVREEGARRAEDAVRLFSTVVGDVVQAFEVRSIRADPAPSPSTELDADVVRRWQLTPRESQVLALLVKGRTNKEIAAALGGSVRTIELHVSRVIAKSGCGSRSQVVAEYWRNVP